MIIPLILLAVSVFGPYCGCQVISVSDGDTLVVKAEIWPGLFKQVTVDLYDVDAPNIYIVGSADPRTNSRCEAERVKGAAATAFLRQLVAAEPDKEFQLENVLAPLPNGRYPAELRTSGGKTLGELMIDAGHAQPWPQPQDGTTRPSWC